MANEDRKNRSVGRPPLDDPSQKREKKVMTLFIIFPLNLNLKKTRYFFD